MEQHTVETQHASQAVGSRDKNPIHSRDYWSIDDVVEYFGWKKKTFLNKRRSLQDNGFPIPKNLIVDGNRWVASEVKEWGRRQGRSR